MVFGHANTKTFNYDLVIEDNIFIRDGCLQTRGDHGAIAFMNPSSGIVENNFFVKCANNQSIPIFWDNNRASNLQNWTFVNNTIENYAKGYVVADPVINVETNLVTAKCNEDNMDCVLRYTLDGSKPDENSMKYENGQQIKIERKTAVLFKAFQNGLIESSTVGLIVDPF